MQLRQYQEEHINWFYTMNKSSTIIGSHLGFWQLWWYVNFFRIFHHIFHPQKYMYRGKFCIYLIIRSWDKKMSSFFWGGGVLWIFMRGRFSSYIYLGLKKCFVCPLYLNADILKIIFWFRVVIFVFMSIKFASVKKFTFPPTPKSLFSKIMCNRRSSCAA